MLACGYLSVSRLLLQYFMTSCLLYFFLTWISGEFSVILRAPNRNARLFWIAQIEKAINEYRNQCLIVKVCYILHNIGKHRKYQLQIYKISLSL